MTSVRRSVPGLLWVAALGLLAVVPAGRAQAPPSGRFAFADTTLLRDTLGLRFDRLFEIADSLQMLPDSLRAHIIRFRLPMGRILAMADSMRVPVDSVGAVIARERFNPFAASAAGVSRSSFKYTSGYTVGRTSSVWVNGGDYQLLRGRLNLISNTEITMDRNTAGGRTSLRQTRRSTTDGNWRLSNNFSLGGRALISGFDALDPGSISNEQETKSEFQLSSRTRQQLTKNLSSDVNFFAGYLDLKNSSLLKRGLSGDVNGRARLTRGQWLSHDLSGGVNGNLSRTRRPSAVNALGTRDLAASLRGALQLYSTSPVGLNLNYAARRSTVETPTDADTVNRLVTSGATMDATLRLRLDNDRYLNLTGNAGTSTSLQGTRLDQGLKGQARWSQGLWGVDADYSDGSKESRFDRRGTTPAYEDVVGDRLASLQVTRPLGRKITTKLRGDISLSQARPRATEPGATPPATPRDSYRQSYRLEGLYNASERLTSGVALEVGLSRSINLPAASTANNTDTRTYRGEWRWNYRLLRGLTAAQTNTVQADYQFYPFAPERNDLSLDFNTVTNLNATLTPRLSVEIIHNARQQPSGEWRVLSDGSGVLLPSDENLSYTLRSRVVWSPSPALSLQLAPEYQASDRNGTVNGVEAPTRTSRRLTFTGGVNLDLELGRRGKLQGSVNRRFTADRATRYQNGVPQPSPVAEQDYWDGSLQLSWEL
jgi:hypothetical protein